MNRSHFALAHHAPRARGFSLVEMAMVLLVVGVLAALFLPATNTMMDNNRRKETRTKLEALESAITRFVMTTGRLPCPADGSLAPGNANYGRELRTPATGVCSAITTGVVPWLTLGVAHANALDGWNSAITYRVRGDMVSLNTSLGLTLDAALDMTACDMAGTGAAASQSLGVTPHIRQGCNPACVASTPSSCTPPSNWLADRGLRVDENATGGILMNPAAPALTGAAYMLISHGSNKAGGYNSNGTLQPANGPGPGVLELQNSNNTALRVAPDFYVDADLTEDPANYYDDIVLRPSVMKVVIDAGLGPRSH
jgi:prepilin-type N-terminal cleavage/methylation domain-containing protein